MSSGSVAPTSTRDSIAPRGGMERVKKYAEICTVGVLIATVWLLFSTPTIVQFSLTEDTYSEDSSSNGEVSSVNATINLTNECSSDFYLNEFGICLPLCGEWQQYPDSTAIAMETIVLLCASTNILLTLAEIILSCIQYKRMLRLPGVLIVYQLSSQSLPHLVLMISYIDIKSLYCSHTDVQETLPDPTPFCYLIGTVYTYCNLQTALFWLCHTILVLCAVTIPFKVRRLLDNPKHSRYLHVAILLACSFLPAISVACSFVPGDYTTLFPPTPCVTEDFKTTFYVAVIPLVSIISPAGISCLVLILWSLVRYRRSSHERRQTALQQTRMTIELKVLVSLCWYTLTLAVIGIIYSVALRSFNQFRDELIDYFECERFGGDCSRSGFENADPTPYTVPANIIATTVFPLATLVYVVNLNEIKKTISKFKGCN